MMSTMENKAGFNLFDGDGEVRAMMREYDWPRSPLGSPEHWPSALRTVVGLMLDSKFPMFVAWGPELVFLYNDAYVEVLGAKHPAALGRRFRDIWAEIWSVISPLIDNALAGEASYRENLPLRMLRKGHEEQTWFTFSYSPVRDDSGTVAGMFCACTETTSQILAERRQAFRLNMADRMRGLDDPRDIIAVASEALGEYLGAARVGYGEIDVSGNIVSIAHDWTNGNLKSLNTENRKLERAGPAVVATLRAGRTLRIDDVLADNRSASHANAYTRLGIRSLLAVPLRRAGKLSAILYLHEPGPRHWSREDETLAEDVAERTWATLERARAEERRRQAEEALSARLAAESERLRLLFQQAPGFMAVVRGPQHVFELANEAYLRLVGERDVIGKPVREVLPELEDQPFFLQLDRVFTTGQPYFALEARVLLHSTRGGPMIERFVDFVYQPVIEADGSVSGIFVEGSDVTDRRHAAEALRAADRRKDEFLAMLAHELRNPLAPISSAAELLKLQSADNPRIVQTSEIIARQVEHMTGLVDDLLDVARVTGGLVTLDKEILDIRSVVAGAMEQVSMLIETRRHRLTVQSDDEGLFVSGDRTRLIQVLANLLNNAAKYTPEGGDILLHIAVSGEELQISVRDNGIGIAPALLPHVFDLFTQADRSPDRSQGGLGLGLSLVRSLAELHGGRVAAYSKGTGLGSEFTLWLPLAQTSGLHAPAPFLSTVPTDVSGLRIMVVDDNVDAAESLSILLQSIGHRVSAAYTAGEALARAAEEMPQVFLLDIGLPDMDGYVLAKRLRALPEHADAVLIALTGYGQAQDHQRSRAAGFDHHLVKPAKMEEITALLASVTAVS